MVGVKYNGWGYLNGVSVVRVNFGDFRDKNGMNRGYR
jgi:hypothetical protein